MIIKIFFLLLLSFALASGQDGIVRDRTSGDTIFFEVDYVTTNAETNKVFALFRIRFDFFVFTISNGGGLQQYSAKADAVVEILDSTGQSIDRQIKSIQIHSGTNVIKELRNQYHQDVMTFSLPTGKYTLLLRIEDVESHRRSSDISRKITIPHFPKEIRSTLIPVMDFLPTGNEFVSPNISGDIFFSTNFGLLVAHTNGGLDSARYVVSSIFESDAKNKKTVLDSVVRINGYSNSMILARIESSSVRFSLAPATGLTLYTIPINGITLAQGRYDVSVTFPDSTKINTLYKTRWLDMPATLSDLDIATYPLQYLLNETEYSSLRRGNRETRIKKFDEFWKAKDPTPHTAYNEMMAEFYRRADHAIHAFRTLKEPNGTLTDRGKIYLLFGQPTTTERTLQPGSVPKEIWIYENLKRTFLFSDPSKQGNYKLTDDK